MIKKESLPTLAELMPAFDTKYSGSFKWEYAQSLDDLSKPMKDIIAKLADRMEKQNQSVFFLFLASDGLIWITLFNNFYEKNEEPYLSIGQHEYRGSLRIVPKKFEAIVLGENRVIENTVFEINTGHSSHELVMEEILKGMKI